jgi:L-ribulokinase
MGLKQAESYVLGLDYGSDSCRAVIIDAADGTEKGVGVMQYPRWTRGLYSDAAVNQFRQHPQDYIDALEGAVREAAAKAGKDVAARIRGIAIDTTGSTPCAVDKAGTPLSLKPEFAENPNAMFLLWKDHTAVAEAARINAMAKTWGGTDYTKYEGGVYSAEWYWSKVLHVISTDHKVAAAACSFVEHCDWMAALLTGTKDFAAIKKSRCAMGHKAMWHRDFASKIPSEFAGGKIHTNNGGRRDNEGGYPSAEFLAKLDPRLVPIQAALGNETWPSDTAAGVLTAEWAGRLGIPQWIPVAVGAYDAHMGAVGGGARPGWLIKVMGTSTCDVIVGPKPAGEEVPVRGICGQVDGSVIPGMVGYEAGQSAFGDVYAWFKRLLMWPLDAILPGLEGVDDGVKEQIAQAVSKKLIPEIEQAVEQIDPANSGIVALDWLNGRRTPDANQLLKGAILGLTLGSDAPRVYRALVEATAFGARAIVERFIAEGVKIVGFVGIGGVARKSSLVMQIVADVLNKPIDVLGNDQCVALGAAMFAAVVAGLYPDIPAAQKALGAPVEKTYVPNPQRAKVYDGLYERYKTLGSFAEGQTGEAAAK